jgi:SAM-dependent methyltransferase
VDYDQTTMPSAYDAGRGYAPAVLDFWLRTIATPIAHKHISDILDLGCGTGRYTAALAAHFRARVVGVDPSKKMLSEATRRKSGDNVTFLRGWGEAVPLPDATIDMVFISMAFHHFGDPGRATEECHRVLRGFDAKIFTTARVPNRACKRPDGQTRISTLRPLTSVLNSRKGASTY